MTRQMITHGVDGNTLKRWREACGLSRERLGAAAGGISSATVKRIEQGTVRPHASTVAALTAALTEISPAPQHDHDPEASRAAEEVGARVARPPA
jgi:predicted transcriptional regulator